MAGSRYGSTIATVGRRVKLKVAARSGQAMASLHLVRQSDSVTVNVSNPQVIEPLRTVANQRLMDAEQELSQAELEEYYR